jgi:hypothetical protein
MKKAFAIFLCLFTAAILIHLALGHGRQMILMDATRGLILFVGSTVSFILFALGWQVRKSNPVTWQRNREAILIEKKLRKGKTLDLTERAIMNCLINEKVLIPYPVVKNGQWELMVMISPDALTESFYQPSNDVIQLHL